jgi:hypothetical protein
MTTIASAIRETRINFLVLEWVGAIMATKHANGYGEQTRLTDGWRLG